MSTTAANSGQRPDYDAAHGAAGAGHIDANTGHHDPHLAHHFDTPEQQFSTGKLGMWTFLATEVLMFGGLFCAYSVYRYNHPEVYLWAHRALDPFWGMVNTIVLLASSFTMAWGVRAAQLNQRGLLQIMLALTFLGGVIFMCVKAVEYKTKWEHHLFPGHLNALNQEFKPHEGQDAAEIRAHTIQTVEGGHSGGGTGGEHGAAHDAPVDPQGTGHNDKADTQHKASAVPSESSNSTRGNAPDTSGPNTGHGQDSRHAPVAAGGNVHQPATSQPTKHVEGVVLTETFNRDAHAGTPDATAIAPPRFVAAGLNPAADAGTDHHFTTYAEMEPTDRAQLNTFFSIYFMMTGLHGVHVVVGMGLIAWLFIRASAGTFSSNYFTPVDLTGLYWHLVDLIWIFLFPLLYLIH